MLREADFNGTDRFAVIRRLGEGGMGVVYEALDRQRNTHVALKTLRSLDAQGILLFKKEFRALQDFQHPNLISLGELIEERGQWFFTMELVRGVDFLSYVRPSGYKLEDDPTSHAHADFEVAPTSDQPPRSRRALPSLDQVRLRAALLQLTRGLVGLHGVNKIHRDIKPSNILVTPSGRVVLLDFGLVTDLAATISTDNFLVGTVAYMAPEQAAFRKVGPEADWYSVGVLLYFALTGQLPFDGNATKILMRKQREEPPAPHTITPTQFGDLEGLCLELLRIEPAKRPTGPEVLRRLEGVNAPLTIPPPQPVSRGPFIGRRDQLAMLQAAFEESQAGGAIVVCVHGESGVGKSALVRRFIESLGEDQVVVLSGRCYERESVPYKAIDGVIDALSQFMGRIGEERAQALLPRMAALLPQVFPVLGRVECFAQTLPAAGLSLAPQELRTRAFAALRELFRNVSAWRPLVLVVDDWQWADADSVSLLTDVLRAPDAPPVLIVCTVRSEGDSARAFSALRIRALPGVVRYVGLGRLAPDEALELASELVALGGRRPSAAPRATEPPSSGRLSAASIAKEAGGHPLFIDELVRHSRRVKRSADLNLDEALWARVSKLEPGVRQLLELVAVAGTPILQETAARAVRASDFGEFAKQLATLRGANLVRSTGPRDDAIEPYHDRVREAVLANLDDSLHTAWHERLAIALEASGRADAESLAAHWRGARGFEKAAHYASIAARQASASLAFERAAALFRIALELRELAALPAADADARALRTGLGDALANAGRGPESAHAYLTALLGADGADALDLRRRAAEQLLRSGHVDEGLRVLASVLGAVGLRLPSTPGGALASLLWERAQLVVRGYHFVARRASDVSPSALQRVDICWSVAMGLSLVDFIRAADFQTRTMRLALEAGDVPRLARSFAMAACFASSESGAARRRAPRLLETAESLALRGKDPYGLAWIPLARGIADFNEGRWRLALARLGESEALFREHARGVSWELASTHAYSLWALAYLGDLRELRRRVVDGLREAEERGDRFAAIYSRTGASHLVRLCDDDPEASRRESTDALRDWSHGGFHLQHLLDLFVQVETDLYDDHAARAYALLDREWPTVKGAMFLRLQNARIFMLDLRARTELALAARSRDPAALLRASEKRAREVVRENMNWSIPQGHTVLAGVAFVRGDHRRAAELLESAARAYESAEMALHAAAARRRLGELAGGERGRAMVASADAWLDGQNIRNPRRMVAMLAPGFP